MQQGRFEGVIPFVLLFLLLFYVHSKLYDLFSYLYQKAKRRYLKWFPPKPGKSAVPETVQKSAVPETVQK